MDKLLLVLHDTVTDTAGNHLDGEWADGVSAYPSGNGAAGEDFRFRMNALPGDMDRDGAVCHLEYLTLKSNFGTPQGATWADGDVDGDCDVDYDDYTGARDGFGSSLPPGEPAPPPTAPSLIPQSAGPGDMLSTVAPAALARAESRFGRLRPATVGGALMATGLGPIDVTRRPTVRRALPHRHRNRGPGRAAMSPNESPSRHANSQVEEGIQDVLSLSALLPTGL